MKKKIIAISLAVVLLAGVIGAVIYFTTRPEKVGGADVVNMHEYRLDYMKIGLFRHPNGKGMSPDSGDGKQPQIHTYDPTQPAVKGYTQQSYGIFKNNFKEFDVVFKMSVNNVETDDTVFKFVTTTKPKRGNGGFTAQIQGVYNGDLWTYEIKATKTQIIMHAVARYRVKVADEGRFDSPRIEVFRGDTRVMAFNKEGQ